MNKNPNQIVADKILTGIFVNGKGLVKAYQTLYERGYLKEEIKVITPNEAHIKYIANNGNETRITTKSAENSLMGFVIGGLMGAFVVSLMAITVYGLIAPDYETFIIGPLGVALTGFCVGGISGGIIGALVGLEIPEKYAHLYTPKSIRKHKILGIYPHNDDDVRYFESVWLVYKG